jgi:hypothetical protein
MFTERLSRATEVEMQAPSGWSQVRSSVLSNHTVLTVNAGNSYESPKQMGNDGLRRMAFQPPYTIFNQAELDGSCYNLF